MGKIKKVSAQILVFVMIFAAVGVAPVQEVYGNTQQTIRVMLGGRQLHFDVQPAIISDRTMVPMRGIFEALGAHVDWDETTRTVSAVRDDLAVLATIGERHIRISRGNEMHILQMDVAPVIVSGRTLVPLRFVSEAFGYDVDWDGGNRVVSISSDTGAGGGAAPEPYPQPEPSPAMSLNQKMFSHFGISPMEAETIFGPVTGGFWFTGSPWYYFGGYILGFDGFDDDPLASSNTPPAAGRLVVIRTNLSVVIDGIGTQPVSVAALEGLFGRHVSYAFDLEHDEWFEDGYVGFNYRGIYVGMELNRNMTVNPNASVMLAANLPPGGQGSQVSDDVGEGYSPMAVHPIVGTWELINVYTSYLTPYEVEEMLAHETSTFVFGDQGTLRVYHELGNWGRELLRVEHWYTQALHEGIMEITVWQTGQTRYIQFHLSGSTLTLDEPGIVSVYRRISYD